MLQALHSINKKCKFRAVFNNQTDVEKNGGTLVGSPTIANGVLTTSSGNYIQYPNVNKFLFGTETHTVRVRMKPTDGRPSSNSYFASKYESADNQRSWACYIATGGAMRLATSFNGELGGLDTCTADSIPFDNGQVEDFHEVVLVFIPSGGKIYFDGQLESVSGNISASAFSSSAVFNIGASFDGDFELVEIYTGELTAEEISLLNSDRFYCDVKDSGLTPLLKYDFVKNQSNYDEAGNAVAPTDTATSYLKQGLLCNNSTTKIDTNLAHGDLNLIGNITIECIINPAGWGGGGFGRIIDNGGLLIYISTTNDNVRVSSNNSATTIDSATNSIILNDKPKHIIITRTSIGVTNFYIDGVLNGSADQSSGVPTVPNYDVFIGNRNAGDRNFDGIVKNVNVFSGLITAEQATQRHQYWKQKRYVA